MQIIVKFPRWSSMSLKDECCSIYLLDVTLVTCCQIHYRFHKFYFELFKFKDLVAKQHPTHGCLSSFVLHNTASLVFLA